MDIFSPNKKTGTEKLGYVVKRGDCYRFVSNDGTKSECMKTRAQAEAYGMGQTSSNSSQGSGVNNSGGINTASQSSTGTVSVGTSGSVSPSGGGRG